MSVELTGVQILAAIGVLLVLVLVWRAGSRATRRAGEAARASVRLASLTGRVLSTAAAIVVVQWIVLTHPGNPTLQFAVLAVPALFSAYTLAKALTVTTVDNSARRRRR